MRHFFAIDDAVKFGLVDAILLENFRFWLAKNRANGRHLHDGRTWTHNSVKAYTALFPYLTPKQIRAALDRLVEAKVLVRGYWSENPYDRSTWYAFATQDEQVPTSSITDLPSRANRSALRGKCTFALQGKSQTDINQINNNNSTPDHLTPLAQEFPGLDIPAEYAKCRAHRARKKLATLEPTYSALKRWLNRAEPSLPAPLKSAACVPPTAWSYTWPAAATIRGHLEKGEGGMRHARAALAAEPAERRAQIVRDLTRIFSPETVAALTV